MDIEIIQLRLEVLRQQFVTFMQHVIDAPGSNHQKQLALVRFDEGHMWMQNAIASYKEPDQAPEMSQVKSPASNNECAPAAETVNQEPLAVA